MSQNLKRLPRKTHKRQTMPRRHRLSMRYLATIDFTVRPKKSTLTLTKFNEWLWGAAERSFLFLPEQVEFFKQFKLYPWQYITYPPYLSKWLAYIRGGLGKTWVDTGLATAYRSSVWIKGRKLYRLNKLSKNEGRKKRLRLPITQIPLYRRLFQKGFMSRKADRFFGHSSAKQTAWIGHSSFVIDYDVVLADILRHRVWTMRRFMIRPILMRKLLVRYMSAPNTRVSRLLELAYNTKKAPTIWLIKALRYSLVTLVYKAFRTLGLNVALMFIRNSLIWVNGQRQTNPFHPCYKGDLIQMDVFTILRLPRWAELYPPHRSSLTSRTRSLTHRRQYKYIQASALISLFKNPIVKRPISIQGPQYRFQKKSFLIYGWGRVAPHLGSWVAHEVLDSIGFFFDRMWRKHRGTFYRSEAIPTEYSIRYFKSEYLWSITQNTSYPALFQNFNFFGAYSSVTNVDRTLDYEENFLMSTKTGGESWLKGVFISTYDLSKNLRLKQINPYLCKKFTSRKGRLKQNPKTRFDHEWYRREFNIARHLRRAVVDVSVRQQNLTVLKKLKASRLRGRRSEATRQQSSFTLYDDSLFAFYVLSRQTVRPGRKNFLNAANLRFLLAFK